VRSRRVQPSPLAIVGGALAIVSCFVAWDDVSELSWKNSFKVPLKFLWDKHASSGGAKLGIPLVCVAGAVAVLSLWSILPVDFLRRVGGLALLGATALLVVQMGRRFGWDNLNDNLGLGPWLAGAGGLLALIAPPGLWPFGRKRPALPPPRSRQGP
jgi:hypothetical protein